MGRLTSVDFVPDLALGIVDQNLALTALDKTNEPGNHDHCDHDEQSSQRPHRTGSYQLTHTGNCVRESGRNTSKDDDRYAIAETALGNLLTQPHQEHGSRDQGRDGRHPK